MSRSLSVHHAINSDSYERAISLGKTERNRKAIFGLCSFHLQLCDPGELLNYVYFRFLMDPYQQIVEKTREGRILEWHFRH